MLTTSDFKKGVRVEIDGQPWTIEQTRSQTPSARGASTLVKVRMRNVLTGQISDRSFKAGEKFTEPDLRFRSVQYLYGTPDGDDTVHVFMDTDSYEQFELRASVLGDDALWLVDSLALRALEYNGSVVGIELPQFVEMELESVAPGSRGDTASGGVTTEAITTTGVRVQVPLYVNAGDRVRIDTTAGTFKDRVK